MNNNNIGFDFSNQVVLVTGGAQGIGLAIVNAFVQCGAQVIVADLQDMSLMVLDKDITYEQVDCINPDNIAQLFSKIEQKIGRLDIVIHNAAFFPLTPFKDITPEILNKTLSVNLSALFWLAQGAKSFFIRQGGGVILATSSVTGPRVAYPGLAHYAASKAGVNGFIRAAALELAPFNIRVNGVEPGMIKTPAMENLGDLDLNTKIASNIPLGRLGEPEDIANAMLFLASNHASYITGQTIIVDGGSTLPESRF